MIDVTALSNAELAELLEEAAKRLREAPERHKRTGETEISGTLRLQRQINELE